MTYPMLLMNPISPGIMLVTTRALKEDWKSSSLIPSKILLLFSQLLYVLTMSWP